MSKVIAFATYNTHVLIFLSLANNNNSRKFCQKRNGCPKLQVLERELHKRAEAPSNVSGQQAHVQSIRLINTPPSDADAFCLVSKLRSEPELPLSLHMPSWYRRLTQFRFAHLFSPEMQNQHTNVEDDDLHEAALPLNGDSSMSVKTRKESTNAELKAPSKLERQNKQETDREYSRAAKESNDDELKQPQQRSLNGDLPTHAVRSSTRIRKRSFTNSTDEPDTEGHSTR